MDFEALFTLALLLLYLVFQVLGGRKQRPKQRPGGGPPPPGAEEPAEHRPPQSLEEALQEIRTALGGGPPPEEPETREPEPAVPRPQKVPESREIRPRLDYHRAEKPFSTEEAFESRPAPSAVKAPEGTVPGAQKVLPRKPRLGPDLSKGPPLRRPKSTPTQVPGVAVPQGSELLQRLRNPHTVREAIVLSEILGPPRALRKP